VGQYKSKNIRKIQSMISKAEDLQKRIDDCHFNTHKKLVGMGIAKRFMPSDNELKVENLAQSEADSGIFSFWKDKPKKESSRPHDSPNQQA